MQDTLKTVIASSDFGPSNLELLNNIHSFYDSAWDKLVLTGAVAAAILGVVVPLFVQWYQKRNFQVIQDKWSNTLKDEKQKLKKELEELVEQKFQFEKQEFETKINMLSFSSNGKTFHLQGNKHSTESNYLDALVDYFTSAGNYIKCSDFANLRVVLTQIRDCCLPKLKKGDLEDLKTKGDCDLNGLLA